MRQGLVNKLEDKFEFMNKVYIECGDGWYQLIHDLCVELGNLYTEQGKDISELEVLQVKEKYGGLRFYIGSCIEGAFEIINKYEDRSLAVCELCGEPGTPNDADWITTLCEYHERKRQRLFD